MFSRRKRRQTLANWRRRRAREFDAAAPTVRVRRRRRAPTPRLSLPSPRQLLARPSRMAALGGALSLAALAGHVGASERYRIHGAVTTGNARVPAEMVYAASGLEGGNVFTADLAAARQGVESLADVRRAEIHLRLPARAWIVVEETAPVLRWQAPSGAMLAIDENGRAVPLPADAGPLPVVHDEAGALLAPGDRLPGGAVEDALAFATRFGDLAWLGGQGFSATTPEGWDVRLGSDARSADRQWANLTALRAQLAASGADVEIIDLRFLSRPYYRLRTNPE